MEEMKGPNWVLSRDDMSHPYVSTFYNNFGSVGEIDVIHVGDSYP